MGWGDHEGRRGGGEMAELLSLSELEEQVTLGIFYKVENHTEHYALHPFWLSQPQEGVMEEIQKTLGKWNSRLGAYVVGFDNARYDSAVGDFNEDHKWIHVNSTVTFYLYKPEVGQALKGTIKRKGHRAAVCILFNLFTATVFASDEMELSYWNEGEEIEFQVQSFKTARKGPVLRGRSLTSSSQSGYDYDDNADAEANFGEEFEEVPQTLNHGKKRKRTTFEDEEETITSPKKKKKKRVTFDDVEAEEPTATSPKKKRKKEKKEPKEEPTTWDSS